MITVKKKHRNFKIYFSHFFPKIMIILRMWDTPKDLKENVDDSIEIDDITKLREAVNWETGSKFRN